MIISTIKYNRDTLTKQQQDFLVKLVPFALKIQEWTYFKANFLNLTCSRGILTSISLADIILVSNWGTHPISKSEFNNKYSNNLSLLEIGNYWKGKFHIYNNKKYRAYKDWENFAIDLSDYYCFSRLYDIPLLCTKEEDQIKALSLTKKNYKRYFKEISTLVNTYYLSEFNM